MNPIAQLQHLSKAFQEGGQIRNVLSDVNLEIPAGKFVILLGRSGSGKSTLLNLISGIEIPSSGEVIVDGMNLTRLGDHQRTLFRRDHIGFVFQFFNLIPTLTVLENVTLPLELAGVHDREARAAARELLDQVGLVDREASFPDKLSGGEQQRVAIARALAADPLLVLADEPTGNLDEESAQQVLDLLLQMTKHAGKTLLMATHNPDIVPLADKVFRVHDGAVLETYAVGHNQPHTEILSPGEIGEPVDAILHPSLNSSLTGSIAHGK